MSRYSTMPPDWCQPRGDGFWGVTLPLSWDIGKSGSGLTLTVPAGFAFDVSVPWWARWILPPRDQRFLKAACLHDYTLLDGWDRVSAAAVFSTALKADGVGRGKRLVMTLAVIVANWT
jgi:hypothetical protein